MIGCRLINKLKLIRSGKRKIKREQNIYLIEAEQEVLLRILLLSKIWKSLKILLKRERKVYIIKIKIRGVIMKKQDKPLKEKDDTLKKDSNELNSFLESWKKVIKEKKENDKKEK